MGRGTATQTRRDSAYHSVDFADGEKMEIRGKGEGTAKGETY